MALRTPEKSLFPLFRRLSKNSASSNPNLTGIMHVVGAALSAMSIAGCTVDFVPSGRYLGIPDGGRRNGGIAGGEDAGKDAGGNGGDRDAQYVNGADAHGADAHPVDQDGSMGTADANGSFDAGEGDAGSTPPECPAETCKEGIGACEQVGRILYDSGCNPTGCSVNGGEPAPAEDCDNALDDDCNGEINNGCACAPDESTACYTGGEDTRNRGICHDGEAVCGPDGGWSACENQQTPLEEEICGNGLNEDCDLETDEGCGGGVECFAGEGICRTAGVTRADGSCDAVPGLPEETDLCGDGLDNDCVNGIDDGCVCPAESTQLCYQGSEDTLNVGVCRPGTQTCIDGRRWNPVCNDQVLPSAEQCNGEDDNCNHEIDENLTRQCSTACGEGMEVCRDGSFQDCNAPQPQPEACNRTDDNCNDRIDEDIAPRVCSTICGEGTEVCRDGAFRDCNAPTPQEEVCNGADDDCDSVTDEGCPCTEGRGICERDGVVQPDGNCSAVPGAPGIEICNGADDNCNGETDETFPDQGQPCTVGRGACERSGEVVCDPPEGAHCNVLPGSPTDEECNGIDDDCNSIIDDGAPPGDPASETCNSLDDDCDSLIDEENAAGCSDFFRDFDGDTYGTAESRCICAPDGEFTAARSGDCADGNPAVNPEAAEVVNRTDDNCNRWIDESPAGYDVMCDETGGSANVTPNSQPRYACDSGLRPEMVSIPADVVSSAVYNTRFGADGQRRAILAMLVPSGAPGFNSVVAQDTSTGFGLSVGLAACPADLPVAPAGRETRCYRSPDEPGGIATPVRFNITP